MTIESTPKQPPYVFEGYDPASGEFGKWSVTFSDAVVYLRDLFNRSREPGKPLDTLSNITREAPLGSLFVAFILGVAFATRRVNPRR